MNNVLTIYIFLLFTTPNHTLKPLNLRYFLEFTLLSSFLDGNKKPYKYAILNNIMYE